MKKPTLMKLALLVVGMFMFAGLNAQILVDYSATQITQPISYQTEGKAFSLYVLPDPVYSPTYVAATNANVNGTSLWTWNLGGLSANVPWTNNTTPISPNTVTITAGSAVTGVYTVTAAEQFGAAGCVDATPISLGVTILAAPTAAITGAAVEAGWTVGTAGAGHEYYRCNAGAGENLTVAFTETGVPAALASYSYAIQKVVTGYDALGAVVVGPTPSTLINYPIAATNKYRTLTINGGTNVTASNALPFVQLTGVDVRTKYVFTLKGYTGSASDGIVSGISHKSDYLAGGAPTIYPFTGDVTVTYWINLPPVTGPIYHISNTFAY